MFRIIDRYLLRQFLQVYVICFISLAGLYVVFDGFTKLDEFMLFAESTQALLRVMGSYYACQSIYLFQMLSGNLTLIAAMFTLTWIQANNELLAILAAGVPTRRVLMPVFGAAVVLSLLTAGVREQVIPRLKQELVKSPRNLHGQEGQEVRPRYDHRTDILLQAKKGYFLKQRMEQPNFVLPTNLSGRSELLLADEAFYSEATADHPAGFLMSGVREPVDILARPSLTMKFSGETERVVFTPTDTAWLKPNECFVVSGVPFEQLVAAELWRDYASTGELISTLHNPSLDFNSKVRVSIHSRVVQPLLDCTLLLLGLPFAVATGNRNVFLSIGVCLIITSIFMIGTIACHTLGSAGLLSPAFAAWLPVMIFGPIGVWLSYRVWE